MSQDQPVRTPAADLSFANLSYVSAFLTRVSGLPADDVPLVLLLGGLASLAGLTCTSMLLSRHLQVA